MNITQEYSSHQLGQSNGKNGDNIRASGTTNYTSLPVASPYGVISVPPKDTEVAILSGGGSGSTDICIGAVQSVGEVEEGEVLLRSKGGAYIRLKNDGTVDVNGQIFGGD